MSETSGQTEVPTTLGRVQADVNDVLQRYFDEQLERARAIDPAYERLWQAMRDVVLAGGKRLRPYLVVLGYQAFGGKDYNAILNVATAQELLHQALLVHDDIIDRDYMRYGRNNVAGSFRDYYASLIDDTNTRDHYANGAALLAGDLLLSAAHQFVVRGPHAERMLPMLSEALFEVGGGELLDTEAVLLEPDKVDSLAIARYKTAGYSIIQPLCMGATAADAPSQAIEQLARVGQHIGIAYQLVDDMLGLFSASSVTGKPDISDLQEGKRTFIIQQTLAQTTGEEHETVQRALGNPDVSQQDLETVRRIAESSGAKATVETRIDEYRQAALDEFEAIDMDPHVREALLQFAANALKREK